ncbi:MAG: hypothetical protein DMD79_03375 [Candidatus Rokuibacteriota bacterium]|nr:MAG: hypothetical protein DMD79_03375 [Candidatus Rokubacteria bacterium]
MRPGPVGGVSCAVALLLLAGCGGSDPPTATRVGERTVAAQKVSTQDAVDALFLGSGPAIPRDGQSDCALAGVWTGFPRGATIRMRIAPAVPASARDAIRRVADQVSAATLGVLAVSVEAAEGDPIPGLNEVTVAVTEASRCASPGCVQRTFAGRGVLRSVEVIEPVGQAPTVYAQHAVGSGVLGLCRIDARSIGGAGDSLMSGGPGTRSGEAASVLTALDLAATQAVWSSALAPGAARRDFLALGLVNIQVGERRRAKP